MHQPLYALQRDVDMISVHLNEHCKLFTQIDWIIQTMKKLDEEQTCQGEQMRRMEEDIHNLKEDMHNLKEDMHNLKEDMHNLKKDVNTLKESLLKLNKHFGIV